jgi:hypothetical protein
VHSVFRMFNQFINIIKFNICTRWNVKFKSHVFLNYTIITCFFFVLSLWETFEGSDRKMNSFTISNRREWYSGVSVSSHILRYLKLISQSRNSEVNITDSVQLITLLETRLQNK